MSSEKKEIILDKPRGSLYSHTEKKIIQTITIAYSIFGILMWYVSMAMGGAHLQWFELLLFLFFPVSLLLPIIIVYLQDKGYSKWIGLLSIVSMSTVVYFYLPSATSSSFSTPIQILVFYALFYLTCGYIFVKPLPGAFKFFCTVLIVVGAILAYQSAESFDSRIERCNNLDNFNQFDGCIYQIVYNDYRKKALTESKINEICARIDSDKILYKSEYGSLVTKRGHCLIRATEISNW